MSLIKDKQLADISINELLIPSEKVAHVQLNNPLEHALLVLVKSGYSAVPVLDAKYKFVGIIGKTVILNQILGLESFEIEKLSEMKVKEVMNTEIPTLTRENSILDGLNAVIDHPFVCLVDQEGYFDGILTRRSILKEIKKNIYINSYKKQ
ncbi:cyclic-di-AMP-binding protein CbpB [Oceanobacillus damuensis]|uniref:cyclic-di-AMP-binding protein CbpB n=1 Tax=Oceanobacillus damuensis TaxID=937928 RepID=UPI000829F684|nr:cyclic-di-AMP-binding protein CbpB [Oceanobacillus damuensis]